MVRSILVVGAVCVVLLVAGCGDNTQAPPRNSETTTMPQEKATPVPRSEDVVQAPTAPVPPRIVQHPSEPVVEASQASVGIAIRLDDNPIGIDLSTGQLMVTPGQFK